MGISNVNIAKKDRKCLTQVFPISLTILFDSHYKEGIQLIAASIDLEKTNILEID